MWTTFGFGCYNADEHHFQLQNINHLYARVERELLSLLGNAEDDKLFRFEPEWSLVCSNASTQYK